jgi:hypothetical protein
MCDENIEIGVTEITNNILVSATPTDQIIDINVLEEVENVELTITPSVVEVNIDVTQELITEVVTVDANTCVNIVDVTVTDATDNVVLNITPSLVEVNINRGQNNLSIEEYDTFADLPTIGDTDTYYITLDENKFWRWDAIDEVYVEIASSDDKIPYLGAYKNSDLGEWGIKSNWFGLDTTPTNPPTAVGTFTWNDSDGTADLILKGGNVTLQIGQEQVLRVVNKTGATLNEADFRAVRVRSVAEGGAQGQRLAVLLAQADSDADSATTIGLVTESIADNQEGFITTSGNVNKINTTGAKSYGGTETWSDGDVLYLSPTHAGYLTNVKPQAPNHTVIIGWVVYAHANNGKIFVKVDNGYELDELHNVKINSPINKDALIYNSSLGVWENKPLSGLLTATSPLSITSNVISISQANATTDGYLSSADWNYFSAKQQPLSGTGFVKATGSVISYDNTVYTPQSRTLTINGTAYDLSADRSWTISVGSGMRNVSSFVATSGQTTFTIVGGYTAGLVDVFVNGVRLNGGDYTATNGTTVVLSVGAIANDLVDIINYTASLTSGITGSGTANYLPLWSGSSNLTNSLIYQDANGVNIDFATTKAFKVTNGVIASIDGGLYAGSGYQLVFADFGSPEYAAIEGSSFSGALSYLRFITNANERMRLTATGYLGIGTTTPRASIETTGYIYSGGNWIPNDTTGAAFYIGDLATGSSYTYISGKGTSSTDTYLSFSTNNLERVRVIANGNVGIGLINPAYKLDVSGDINITGSFRINGVAIGGGSGTVTGTGTANYIAKWSGTSAIGNSLIFDNGTNVGIGTASPTQSLTVVMNSGTNATGIVIKAINDGGTASQPALNYVNGSGNNIAQIVADNGTGYLAFNMGASNTERMRITSGGNVGIGTSSPIRRLEVASDGSNWISGTFSGTGGTDKVVIGNLSMPTIGGHNSALNAWSNFAVAGVNIIFAPYGSESMRLTDSGILGVGTNSPSTGFGGTINNVKLALRNGTPGQAGGTSVLLIGGDNNHYSYIEAQHTGGGNTYLSFGTSTGAVNPTEKMRITSGGKIGIGTSNPTEKLNVYTNELIWGINIQHGYTSGTQYYMNFQNSSGGQTGSIMGNGTMTSYNITSDYRLKEDLKPISGLEKVNKINVYDFKWKNSNERMDGVVAHELQEILPYAVTGIKDGKDNQQVDYSKIVPVLVQAIKELNAKLEAK